MQLGGFSISDLEITYNNKTGIKFRRIYTKEGVHPYETVEWATRDIQVTSMKGETIFEQKGVEFPKSWSQNSIQIVASKYFHGPINTPQRETSLKQLIDRVVDTLKKWGLEGRYFASLDHADIFADELTHILLNQQMAFNSPVWFNLGTTDKPQGSACFINSVEDTMESILDLAKTEGMIFKHGSGSGVNVSTLRGKGEGLSTGGSSSGPLSFMKGLDAFAGSIKSGGKTRRAAKMVLLDDWHPDLMDFIDSKVEEEKKAWALIDAGYDPSFTGEAYSSIFFQNANHSVRMSDKFMEAVVNNKKWDLKAVRTGEKMKEVDAIEVWNRIAEATHICGDPGLQYSSAINKWHTCKNSGMIDASNPCSEYVFLNDTACNLASINLLKYRNEDSSFDVDKFIHTIDLTISAQEIIVGNASYPTPKIEDNSHTYRTLGLGYTNLGALLMSLGYAYDSDKGRNVAAAITSLMTGRAYYQSALIAEHMGAFDGFEINKEPMMQVMQMHADAATHLKSEGVDGKLMKSATSIWDDTLSLGWEHGYRNAQATVLAPTGCLVPNTLITTDKGLLRLGKIGNTHGDKWQDIDLHVLTDEGPKKSTKFFVNGSELTRKIVTSAGYEIKGTYAHRIKVVDKETNEWKWKRMSDIMKGDILPIALNQMIGSPQPISLPPLGDLHWNADFDTIVPREVNENLSELLGYYMGDGSLHAKGLRFCVSNNDLDVVDRLNYLIKDLFNRRTKIAQKGGYVEVSIHSTALTIWWDACGFSKLKPTEEHIGKGYVPYIPDSILETNDQEIYGAFLRGLYEADGTIIENVPSVSTAHESFAREIKTLLLVLGIPTSTKIDIPYGNHLGKLSVYAIRLRNKSYNNSFLDKIGFIGERKDALVSREISERSQRYDRIPMTKNMADIVVPVGHSARRNVMSAIRRNNAVPRAQIQRLYEETEDEILGHSLKYFYDTVDDNIYGGEQFTFDLSVPSNVTYVANGFMSHNTISFMMSADTTGIEPEVALVKFKKLVGGGYMKIVNNTIPLALKRLGYSATSIEKIVAHIDEKQTVEGCAQLKNEHLSIFDTSIKPQNSVRFIHHMGHIKMMSAVQPFLSGAISKTVNMPEECTVEEIANAYMAGWEYGLKAIAIYRDNSKRLQPLVTKDESKKEKEIPTVIIEKTGPIRRRLPDTRNSRIHKFEVDDHEGYIIVGLYHDGQPGEVFIKMSKQGSTLGGVMDSLAILISMSLQYGVPLSVLVRKFIHSKFEPSGMTQNPKIPIASSIIDYIFRWLALEFLPEDERPGVIDYTTIEEQPETSRKSGINKNSGDVFLGDNRICSQCGAIAVRSGSCYACPECGTTSGCS